ncbi:MAG TPA: hypothetical protein VLD59_08140 [Steroidobacteraceae bacterium]|nr:hypothetical protein [Steroidobacteraceae bacterium]
MKTFTIRIHEPGDGSGFDVVDSEGRHADGLCWDDFIGQVVSLTHPKLGVPQYMMRTDAGWAENRVAHNQRMETYRQQLATAPQLMLEALRQWRQAEQSDDPREYANAQRARDEAIAKATSA